MGRYHYEEAYPHRIYYFIIGEPSDRIRTTSMARLELSLTQEFSSEGMFGLAEWPYMDLRKYHFLGRVIWRRPKKV